MSVDAARLRQGFQRAERLKALTALGLVSAPLAFILLTLVVPISSLLFSSIRNPEIGDVMPNLSAEILRWDGKGVPPSRVVRALAADLIVAESERQVGRVAARLNHEIPGFRTLLLETAERVTALERAIGRAALLDNDRLLSRLVALDSRWGERRYWVRLRQAAPPYSLVYMLRTIDREYDLEDRIVLVSEQTRLYVDVFWRTLWICAGVTVICLLMGYPIAYLLATLPTTQSNLCILFLLLPLWTSVLVKSLAWLVALQNEGVLNDIGTALGLWDERVALVRNRIGTYVSMVHVLLPFMTFPLYSVMKGIDEYHLKAAATMGATPLKAFLKVYLPQSLPGVGGGVLLVFILALGLYVPPALVGGPSDQMLSYFIAWGGAAGGLSAALSVILMGIVAVFLLTFHRLIGIDKTLFR